MMRDGCAFGAGRAHCIKLVLEPALDTSTWPATKFGILSKTDMDQNGR
jgi:hypothetical protein